MSAMKSILVSTLTLFVVSNPSWCATHFTVNSNTVALWTFSSRVGNTFTDSSPNGNSLSSANNFALTASPSDSAVVFTGSASLSASYLSHANASALTIAGTGRITYEVRMFLKPGQSGAGNFGGWVIGTYDGVSLQIGSDGHFQAAGQKVRNGTGYWIQEVSPPGIVPLNRWFDLSVAFDQSTGQAYGYIDGVPIQLYSTGTSNPITDPFRVSTGSFFVGNNGRDLSYQFSGTIDEIRVSNDLILGAGLPLIVGSPPATQTHFPLNSSTVALWSFASHNSGTFTDLSPNAFSLSNANNFALTSSPYDSAGIFTGTATIANSYLTHAYASALTIGATGKMTFEARVYLTPGQGGWLMGTYDGLILVVDPNGRLEADGQKVRNGTGYWIREWSVDGIVPRNRWVDIAIAFDQSNGQAYGYIDGTPFQLYSNGTNNPVTDPFRVSTGPFFVGNNGRDNYQFSGKVDEVRVSNDLVLGLGFPLIVGMPPVPNTPPTNLSYSSPTALYIVGNPISQNIPTVTGSTPLTYTVSPALPTGLILNSSTGIISGTPTTPVSAAGYTVTVTNSTGNTKSTLIFAVVVNPVDILKQPGSRSFTLKIPGSSAIVFALPKGNATCGKIEILDMKGMKVWESRIEIGSQRNILVWNGLASNGSRPARGLYLVRMTGQDFDGKQSGSITHRMVYSP